MTRAETPPLAAHTQHALEARFGLRLAAALSEAPVGHDIDQRLRVSRELALSRAAASARVARGATVVSSGNGGAALGSWWLRLGSLLPLLVLAVGLLFVEWLEREERIRAAADIDVVLLADELPPKAYADPGFTEFLKRAEP